MRPVEFDQANIVFNKPEGMTDEECAPCPAWNGQDWQGNPLIVTCWQLSPEELKQINETGQMWLGILSNGLPPHWMSTVNPFQPQLITE
ncbi:MAG: hypothetical protein ACRCVT_10060 [Leadbetterella sp.]